MLNAKWYAVSDKWLVVSWRKNSFPFYFLSFSFFFLAFFMVFIELLGFSCYFLLFLGSSYLSFSFLGGFLVVPWSFLLSVLLSAHFKQLSRLCRCFCLAYYLFLVGIFLSLKFMCSS